MHWKIGTALLSDMKRRTNPNRHAAARASRPAPLPPSDHQLIHAFSRLYQAAAKTVALTPERLDVADSMDEFLTDHGLEFAPTGETYEGCGVWALTRGGDVLATFSAQLV